MSVAAHPRIRVDDCRLCGSAFEQELRQGRPRTLCESCAGDAKRIAEKQRAYRDANKAEIAEKKRAYYDANKAEIAEKKRAYYDANKAEIAAGRKLPGARWHCGECGEPLRRNTEDGLCGFCRKGTTSTKPADDDFDALFAELAS